MLSTSVSVLSNMFSLLEACLIVFLFIINNKKQLLNFFIEEGGSLKRYLIREGNCYSALGVPNGALILSASAWSLSVSETAH